MKRYILLFVLVGLFAVCANAQSDTTDGILKSADLGLEYEINAGINIGGSAPLPIPGEIRKVLSYGPGLNLSIGATVTKWLSADGKWGLALMPRFETKGMHTKARTKNYGMAIIRDGSEVSGNWTGKVSTKYRAGTFTLPIVVAYKINDRWKVNFGPYISAVMNKEFSGYVYDGYLREGNPTGNKVVFDGDSQAPYDFSDDMRTFQWGLQAGASWLAFKHLSIQANLTWGLNNIFKSSFKTVTFDLYPIYLNVGFGYAF
ncbi:MAG: PorT family protein [Muribaculum sp.]|nr:PorT family protein [Muribaculum sp.]